MDKIIGRVAPLDKSNVDTDQIIPKQFLTSIKRTGFGEFLFDAWRYLDEGYLGQDCTTRPINPDFVLNQAQYKGANILLAGENFGCGSSREHAPWALKEYGFAAIIAPSFADIFYNNCFNNHILAIDLDAAQIKHLFALSASTDGLNLTIDLLAQTISAPNVNYSFELDSFRKECLVNNLDDIAVTLSHSAEIKQYEQQRKQITPWMFADV
jgi:3-isopropylmalate/(R)-2-methylmalate dehydratase small subunit